ncbi:unnamed protein product [Ilex paraguariensis]|uniref:AAA+ ATPase domain-containing protein n=1 Tax=Ilex paraguariensis TaxID=185542 RepID=A0ABC8SW01_9AQUA
MAEVVMNIACSIVPELVKKPVVAIGREVGYLFHYNRNIADLRNHITNLKELRVYVQGKVGEAHRNGEVTIPEVDEWLRTVNIVIEEYGELLHAEELVVNNKCFIGLCPDLKSRYKVSKKAKKGISIAAEFENKTSFYRVSVPAPLPTLPSLGSVYFESRESTFAMIVDALKDDEINIIGVWGMGGVGKTTVVKEIAKYAEINHLFDEVVMAVVSLTLDIRKIQDQIADMLGLHMDVESDYGRAGRLHERIKRAKRILIILDDVWESLSLDAIGIPHSHAHKGCKIVLTSRNERVCVEMDAQKCFCINVLSKSDAWTLFKRTAGNIEELPDVLPIAKEVAQECAGLPLAIVTVARALRGKSDVVWKDALHQLNKSVSRTISGVHDYMYVSLQLSYDYLESEELKHFFLLCCLFPKGYDIPIESIVRYGMGLRLFEHNSTLVELRVGAQTMFEVLKSCSLLLDGNVEESIRMHDIVRDFAIKVASRGEHAFLIRAGWKLTEWPKVKAIEQYRVISLIENPIQEFSSGNSCPNLEMLLLQCESDSVKISGDFFDAMTNLKVLDIRQMSIPQMPTSLGCLKKLRTLCLQSCKVPDLSVIGNLKDLEILSIADPDVVELPLGFRQLIKLRLLDLTDCQKLRIIPPGVMSSWTLLECLYMRNSFKDWGVHSQDKETSNASLTELKASSCLKGLEMHIPDAELYPKDLVFDNLLEFKITIGNNFDQHYASSYTTNLKLETCQGIALEGGGVNMLLKRAQLVVLKDLGVVGNVLCDLTDNGFSDLKCLRVDDCHGTENVVNTNEWMPPCVFPVVEVLDLSYMCNLREICQGHLPSRSFCKLRELRLFELPALINLWDDPIGNSCFGSLRVVTISDCDELKHLFRQCIAGGLRQLEELDVRSCSNMEEILAKDGEGAVAQENVIVFPELKSMKLVGLPNLMRFCHKTNILPSDSSLDDPAQEPLFDRKVVFPALEELDLWGLYNIKDIWHIQLLPTESFCRLRKLSIGYCENLITVIPPGVGEWLKNLEEFSVWDCDLVEEVCEDHDLTLPQIRVFRLLGLPRLKHIWWNKVSSRFYSLQNLKTLRIYRCKGLKYLFSVSASKGLKQLQTLKIGKCDMMKEIVAAESQEEDYDVDTIVFPQLQTLEIKYMLQLTSFYQGNCTLQFLSLEKLMLEKCPLMKTFTEKPIDASTTTQHFFSDQSFSAGLLITPKLHNIRFGYLEEVWKGDLNSTVHFLSKERKPGEWEGKEEGGTVTAQQFHSEIVEEEEDKV